LQEQLQQSQGEMERVVAEVERERARGPSRVLETLAARLKTQLLQKDKRLGQLKEAIKELEKKLVVAMQKAADDAIQSAKIHSSEIDKAEDARAGGSTMAAKLKRVLEELQRAKEREALWGEERSRLAHESRASTEDAQRAALDAQRGRREAAVARASAERSSPAGPVRSSADRGVDRVSGGGGRGERGGGGSGDTGEETADMLSALGRSTERASASAQVGTFGPYMLHPTPHTPHPSLNLKPYALCLKH
jgi:centrosomal protein CEP290